MSLLAEETVSSFAIENTQSDSEGQKNREEAEDEGWCMCVCVGCISFLRLQTCASGIRVPYLIRGADGLINRTSVRAVIPSRFVRVCVFPCQDLYMCLSALIFLSSPLPLFAPRS